MRRRGARDRVRSDRHEADLALARQRTASARRRRPGGARRRARAGLVTATWAGQAALARHGVPHRVLGSLGLYERAEVKDALAYLTLLANPADAQAFRRAVGSPKRGVGTSTANRVVALARDAHNGDLIAASQAALDAWRASAPRPCESGSPTSGKDSRASGASCAPDARSGTSSWRR